ncbi:MAG TPA: HAMP domain-containing histidine kinase [Candidatus Limivivens intestinipullorum]|uniref:histidine kinase n=1 Tax=Candidatus Limivivens intestinipullorum TaxID=2840858 RepID=A0A9D1ETL9_9FIRM|nr:HAMP domain-containing histidine kinase [Candidatus Limivivens intestinipullorum]
MGKSGKETKLLFAGLAATALVSFLLAAGIAALLAKDFQRELLRHDYGIAGYLLNHGEEPLAAAFTALPDEKEIEEGRVALDEIAYNETTPIRLLPVIREYRNRIALSVFLLLLFLFGAVGFSLFLYLRRQHSVLRGAENAIRGFLDGDTGCRIECAQTGDWYSLFHTVNEMASILSAHAENQRQTKEFLQDMISDVSHQIKTPLSALKMYQEIIESHKNDAAAVSGFAEKSQREIRRMEDVIYTLLKLARLDAGIIRMEKTPERIADLMGDVLERFETRAERERKTITLSGKDDTILFCDALWVSEAVGNIVKNALDHTEEGGHIAVRWRSSPVMTQIEISDDGKGIHPEDLYNIFKRFYRSRFSSDVHGIGLGLPLAKSIVEAHGGTISVNSAPNAGATFTLNFLGLTDE